MKKQIAALLFALISSTVLAKTFIARQGDDYVRIFENPCTSELVISRLEAGQVGHFRAAMANFQGKQYVACAKPMGNVMFLVYEDGDQGIIPIQELKLDSSDI